MGGEFFIRMRHFPGFTCIAYLMRYEIFELLGGGWAAGSGGNAMACLLYAKTPDWTLR